MIYLNNQKIKKIYFKKLTAIINNNKFNNSNYNNNNKTNKKMQLMILICMIFQYFFKKFHINLLINIFFLIFNNYCKKIVKGNSENAIIIIRETIIKRKRIN